VSAATAVPVGLLGEQMKTTSGRRSAMAVLAASTSMVKSSWRGPEDPAGARAAGDEGVHGVGRFEADGAAAGSAEGLQQLLDDFVGAVGGPDLVLGDGVAAGAGEVAGQLGAQFDRVAVGVAVELPGRLR